MGRKRKDPIPDYELLFKSAVSSLKQTYGDYKKAMIESIRWTWYGQDGNYCEMDFVRENREKAHRLWYEVDRLKAQVEEYRKLMEGAEE